jgi:ParB-like chromosome segregation protein Spo0J
MSDEDAYMALALNNAQGELHPLERGLHVLPLVEKGKHGKSAEAYAKLVNRSPQDVRREVAAAEVASKIANIGDLLPYTNHLSELRSAPEWLWRSLVSRLVSEGWTVEQARQAAPAVQGCAGAARVRLLSLVNASTPPALTSLTRERGRAWPEATCS